MEVFFSVNRFLNSSDLCQHHFGEYHRITLRSKESFIFFSSQKTQKLHVFSFDSRSFVTVRALVRRLFIFSTRVQVQRPEDEITRKDVLYRESSYLRESHTRVPRRRTDFVVPVSLVYKNYSYVVMGEQVPPKKVLKVTYGLWCYDGLAYMTQKKDMQDGYYFKLNI